jgi:hypothetical protein
MMNVVRISMAAALGFAGFAASAQAQSTYLGASAARSTYNEVSAENRQAGFGFTGSAGYERGELAVEGELHWRSLSPQVDTRRGALTLKAGVVRVRYEVWRSVDFEVGVDSRIMSPEFSAQDAAVVLVGLRHESDLSSVASFWIRGAAVPVSRFNGGGSGGVGLALGFGVRAGPADGTWRAVAVYDFQRLDRTVRDVEVPIQYEGVRIGIEYSVF